MTNRAVRGEKNSWTAFFLIGHAGINMLSFIKTEFGKFGDVLAATKKKIESARNEIEKAETRTRAIEKKLEKVETLPVSDGEKQETELPDTRQI